MKKKVCLLTLILVLCLMLPAMSPAPAVNYTRTMNDILANQVDFVTSQEGAWSDDFDHGNITESGWSTQGFSSDTDPWKIRPANITAKDKTMRVYSTYWSEAWRTSNVAYGSWAFDVHCVDIPAARFYIAFVSGKPVLYPPVLSSMPFEYGIIIVVGIHPYGKNSFVLYRRNSTNPYLSILERYRVDNILGWWHIEITRDYDGNFEVYVNDTLGITYRDTIHTTSDLFTFTAEAGIALDNIVVDPTPPTTRSTTPTDGQPPDMTVLLVVGGGIALVVILVAVVKLRK